MSPDPRRSRQSLPRHTSRATSSDGPVTVVVGGGAMGTLAAAALGQRRPVTVVPLRHREPGEVELTAWTPAGRQAATVEVCGTELIDGGCGLLIVCTRSTQMALVEEVIEAAVAKGALVVLLQNGIRALDLSRRHPESVVGCVVNVDAQFDAPRVVRSARQNRHIIVGPLANLPLSALHAVEDVLADLAPVRVTSEIRDEMWTKLVTNGMLNPLCALWGWSVGQVLDDRELVRLALSLAAEAIEVGERLGYRTMVSSLAGVEPRDISADVEGVRLDRVVGQLLETYASILEHRSSMCRDLDAGRPTEVTELNGRVARAAVTVGTSAPRNAEVTRAILHATRHGRRTHAELQHLLLAA